MTVSTDMSTPVTRGELREELEQLEIRIDRRFEQVEQKLEGCATKADLEGCATKADLERYATKADLERYATKLDLEAWGLALMDRMQAEIARHFGAFQEWMSAQFAALDEKYTDLPGRVGRLETTVYGPEGPRVRTEPRRRRRAGRRAG